MKTYSQSEFREWMHCHRAHSFKYGERIERRQKSRALMYGSTFHQCLDLLHNGKDIDEVLAHVDTLRPDTEMLDAGYEHPFGDEEGILMEISRLRAHMASYIDYYGWGEDGSGDSFTMLAVEFEFECEIPNFYADWDHEYDSPSRGIMGIMDGLILDRHDKVWLLETKTAAAIDPSVLANLCLDFQTNLYLMCAREMFDKGALPFLPSAPIGVCYNVTEKPKERLLSSVFETVLSDGQYFVGTKKAGKEWHEAQALPHAMTDGEMPDIISQDKRPENYDEFETRVQAKIQSDTARYFVRDWHRVREENLADTMNTVRSLIREIETSDSYPNQSSCSRCSYKSICTMPRTAWPEIKKEDYISRRRR